MRHCSHLLVSEDVCLLKCAPGDEHWLLACYPVLSSARPAGASKVREVPPSCRLHKRPHVLSPHSQLHPSCHCNCTEARLTQAVASPHRSAAAQRDFSCSKRPQACVNAYEYGYVLTPGRCRRPPRKHAITDQPPPRVCACVSVSNLSADGRRATKTVAGELPARAGAETPAHSSRHQVGPGPVAVRVTPFCQPQEPTTGQRDIRTVPGSAGRARGS